jgi:hypothetical protein
MCVGVGVELAWIIWVVKRKSAEAQSLHWLAGRLGLARLITCECVCVSAWCMVWSAGTERIAMGTQRCCMCMILSQGIAVCV